MRSGALVEVHLTRVNYMNLIRRLIAIVLLLTGAAAGAIELKYDHAIQLDAEDLAEQGIAQAYTKLRPLLKPHVPMPLLLIEKLDASRGLYSIEVGGSLQHIVPSPVGGDEYESWGVATVVLFDLVNSQLVSAPVKLYALNAGNDLMGILLTEEQAAKARKQIKRRSDWPYIPKMVAPFFGQYH